ncbi:MAG: hypothetical protein AAGC55_05810, partial [Myxococcota bacterium]
AKHRGRLRRAPMAAGDFVDALRKLYSGGYAFDEAGTLTHQELPDRESRILFAELAEKYPAMPDEVAALVETALVGSTLPAWLENQTETSIAAKLNAVRELVVTSELADRFFLHFSSKGPVLESVDWETGIKTAEQGIDLSHGIPYALITLLGSAQIEDESEVLANFYVGEEQLEVLIDELQAALGALRNTKRVSQSLQLKEENSDE